VTSSLINMLSLVVVTVTLAIGQLLFKQAGLTLRGSGVGEVVRSPTVYIALGLYGAATLLWIWVLSRVPLSRAYPWIASCVVLVPLLSSAFFKEPIEARFWVGGLLVMIGLVITQWSG
jgi:undecaprenyl phosphate-alpha-L-ara4N flippase subunit ArnE